MKDGRAVLSNELRRLNRKIWNYSNRTKHLIWNASNVWRISLRISVWVGRCGVDSWCGRKLYPIYPISWSLNTISGWCDIPTVLSGRTTKRIKRASLSSDDWWDVACFYQKCNYVYIEPPLRCLTIGDRLTPSFWRTGSPSKCRPILACVFYTALNSCLE